MLLNINVKPEIVARVWQIVNALPQRSAILESDAKAWVDQTVMFHGEAAIWHAIRLRGFGGSEIGALVRNKGGVRADFQASAHDIVASKLMRKAPLETSAHMTRGHENEEPHARRFYAKYGAQRDIVSFDALKNAQGKRPWMRYSPDDLVTMPVEMMQSLPGDWYPSFNDGQPRRWLIDYKAPSQIDASDSVAFQYACQLSQGAILCAEAGIELDGMLLSQFDWSNWALKDDAVVWDESLGRLVLEAGDHYWEHVCRGTLPDYIFTPEVEGVEAYKAEYQTAAEMVATLSALSDASKKRSDEIREQLLKPLNGKRIGAQKISFGFEGVPILTLGVRNMLDRDAAKKLFTDQELDACAGKKINSAELMEQYLKDSGVEMAQFKVRDLDAAKVFEMAVKKGLDPNAIVLEQLTLSAAKSIKEKMAQFVDAHYPLSAAAPQIQTVADENLGSLAIETTELVEAATEAPAG